MLRAVLLGTSQIDLQGIPLSHKLVGKELALFAYLARNQELCPRTKLVDLLWTDINEQKARENLRSLLYSLRQTVGDYLIVTRHAVGLNRHLPYWLDVEVFSSLPAQMGSQDPRFRAEVLSLYNQDFLDGFSISGAPVFDAWLTEQREQLRARAVSGWQQLVSLYMERQQYEESLAANRRLLALAPWHEEAHQQQMQLLAATGQRSAALAHYELCRQRLQDELDVPPSSETVALYHRIRTHHTLAESAVARFIGAEDARRQVAPTPASGATMPLLAAVASNPSALNLPASNLPASNLPASNLPAPTPASNGHAAEYRGAVAAPPILWGRQYELTQLQQWIQVEHCRCVAIVGAAGEGKSTLTHELVKLLTSCDAAMPTFAGVIVFSCRNPLPMSSLLQEWLDQLRGQQLTPLPSTLDRQLDLLVEHMQQRAFLFVLDDFDHCFSKDGWASSADQAAFRQIWRLFIDRPHRCTLLLTARKLTPLQGLSESPGRFRQINLGGVELEASRQLLKSYGLEGSSADFSALHDRYSGNPLMLKLAAQTIDHLFDGDIAAFLQERALFIGGLGDLLSEQLSGMAPLEQTLLTWLALAGKPISSQLLWELLTPRPAKHAYFTALQSLSFASLIEVNRGMLHIRSQFKEYICCQLTDQLFDEIRESVASRKLAGVVLHDFALSTSAARLAEGKFDGLPVDSLLDRLEHYLGKEQLILALQQLLTWMDANSSSQTRHAQLAQDVVGRRSYIYNNLNHLLASSLTPKEM